MYCNALNSSAHHSTAVQCSLSNVTNWHCSQGRKKWHYNWAEGSNLSFVRKSRQNVQMRQEAAIVSVQQPWGWPSHQAMATLTQTGSINYIAYSQMLYNVYSQVLYGAVQFSNQMLNTQYCTVFTVQCWTHSTVQYLQHNSEHTQLYSVYSPMLNTQYCILFSVQCWSHSTVQCLQSNAEHTVLYSIYSTILNTHNCTVFTVQCWTHSTVYCFQSNADHTVLYSVYSPMLNAQLNSTYIAFQFIGVHCTVLYSILQLSLCKRVSGSDRVNT